MARERDASGRFVSMKVKVEVDGADAAASTVAGFEKKLNAFGDRMTQAAGATVAFGASIRKTGANAIDYAGKIDNLSKAMQQSKHLSERLAGAGIGVVAHGMKNAAQGVKGLGEQVMKSGFAIGSMGRLIVSQLSPYAQWADKSRVVKATMTALSASVNAAKVAAQGLGSIGHRAVQGVANAAKNAYNHFGGLSGILGGIKNRMMGMASGLTGSLSIQGIAEISDKFDRINIDLAQTIKLMSKDAALPFTEAFDKSEDLMGKIVQKAGPLPGEAADYAKAMAIAGTVVNKTTHDQGRTLQLVSDMTALWGGDGVMAAKLLNQSLDGTKGRINSATMNGAKLFAIIRSIPGYAKLTSAEFNRLSADKRLEIITRAMALSQDKISALADTYDAKMGAAKANWEWFVAHASPNIFKFLKAGLDVFSNAIMDADGKFTPLAKSIIRASKSVSEWMVSGLYTATNLAKILYNWFDKFSKSEAFNKMASTANTLMYAVRQAGAGLIKGAGGMDAMQNRAASVGDTFTNSFLPIVDKFALAAGPLYTAIGSVSGLVFDTLWPAVDGVAKGLNEIARPVTIFMAGLYDVVTTIATNIGPGLKAYGDAIGTLAHGLGSLIAPIFRMVANVALTVYGAFANWIVPVLGKVASGLALLVKAIGGAIGYIGKITNQALYGDDLSPVFNAATNAMTDALDEHSKNYSWMMMDNDVPSTNVGNDKQEDGAPDGRGGGGRTIQDFRYSRFDISQKFDESFDPDRIASVFAEKLGRIGDRRLQSGFEPMFSVR